jgi:hypothetical protein
MTAVIADSSTELTKNPRTAELPSSVRLDSANPWPAGLRMAVQATMPVGSSRKTPT